MTDIQQILRDHHQNLTDKFFANTLDTIPLIEYCAGTSTIRAFRSKKGHCLKYKPLSIFRCWAFRYLSVPKLVERLNKKENFEDLRADALQSLMSFWTEEDGGTPEFYQFNKLIDLLFKYLPLWTALETNTKSWLFENAKVPLDKFSLDLLRRCKPTLRIPKNASMNYVTSNNYANLQEEIMRLCKGYQPILFDLYAWDETHRPKVSFELIPLDKKKTSA